MNKHVRQGRDGKYNAFIRLGNCTAYLGAFNTTDEASATYQRADRYRKTGQIKQLEQLIVAMLERKRQHKQGLNWRWFIRHHALVQRWYAMHTRCYSLKQKNFEYYGGRGIEVCERWHRSNPHGLKNFLADMGDPPAGKSLDRIDNDGNYGPDNCRWATPKEQAANKWRRR